MICKRLLGGLLSAVIFLPAVGAAQPAVRIAADGQLPIPMLGTAACVTPSGRLQIVGGFTGSRSLSGILTRGPQGWVMMARLPEPTHDAAAGYLKGELFIFGGGQAYSTRALLRVSEGKTVRVADLAHPLSDAVARPYRLRSENGLILVGGHGGPPVRKVYFITASGGHTHWRTLFSLPRGLRYAAVAVEAARVDIAGGQSLSGPVATVWTWHPGDAGPQHMPSLPVPLDKAAAFAWRGTLYVVGGLKTGGGPSSAILAYRAGQGGWRRIGQLPEPLADMGYVQVGPDGYLLGGVSGPSPHSVRREVWRLLLH